MFPVRILEISAVGFGRKYDIFIEGFRKFEIVPSSLLGASYVRYSHAIGTREIFASNSFLIRSDFKDITWQRISKICKPGRLSMKCI